MKIVVLSRGRYLYSTQRILGAARARGHEASALDPFDCWVCLGHGRPSLHGPRGRIPTPDVVLPRIGVSYTFYGLSVLRQLETMGAVAVNGHVAVARSRDKLRTMQIFTEAGIPTPRSAFVRHPRYIGDALKHVGGTPAIVKVLEGAQGVGVLLAESESSALSLVETMHQMNQNILLQQFVEEARGRDIRALVVGGKVVASMSREAVEGEFRSNLHRGGSARAVELEPSYRETAVRAAQVLGLNVAGVDMLESREGPKVLEVNSSPGLEGIERSTGVDVAAKIVQWIERHALAPSGSAGGEAGV